MKLRRTLRSLAVAAAASLFSGGAAQAIDIGTDPTKTFGVSAGMEMSDLSEILHTQGFSMSGVTEGAVETKSGQQIGNVYAFTRPDGTSIVNIEVGVATDQKSKAFRIWSVRFVGPGNDLVDLEAKSDAKYGVEPDCISETAGGLFHIGADGDVTQGVDCNMDYHFNQAMSGTTASQILSGSGSRYTASAGLASLGDGKSAYMESIQDNRIAAEVYATATGMELPGASDEEMEKFERMISGRQDGYDVLLDLLTNPDGYPVTAKGLSNLAVRQSAVDYIYGNGSAFLKPNSAVSGTPTYSDSSGDLSSSFGFDERARAIMTKLHGADAPMPEDTPVLQHAFRAASKFDNGVNATYEVSFASSPEGGLGIDTAMVLSTMGIYDFSDLDRTPSIGAVTDWLEREFPGHCKISSPREHILVARQSYTGDFEEFEASDAESCKAWAERPMDIGHSYWIELRVRDKAVPALAVHVRDEGRTESQLMDVYRALADKPDAVEETVELDDPASATEGGNPQVSKFLAASDKGSFFPALLGVEFGMSVGEVVDLMKAEGYKFFKAGYYTTLVDEPNIEDVTGNLIFRPYVQRIVQDTGNDDARFHLYSLGGTRSTWGMTYKIVINFMSPAGKDDYRNGRLILIQGTETIDIDRLYKIAEQVPSIPGEFIGQPACMSEGREVNVGHTFWDENFRRTEPEADRATDDCNAREFFTPHRYQATVRVWHRGNKSQQYQVLFEDHDPIREQFLE